MSECTHCTSFRFLGQITVSGGDPVWAYVCKRCGRKFYSPSPFKANHIVRTSK